jgi:hypothetical protein
LKKAKQHRPAAGAGQCKQVSKKSTGERRGAGLEKRGPTGNGQASEMGNLCRRHAQWKSQHRRSGESIAMAELVKQLAIDTFVITKQ